MQQQVLTLIQTRILTRTRILIRTAIQIPTGARTRVIPRATRAKHATKTTCACAVTVTEGVAGYEDRRDAIKTFYEANVGDWLKISKQWTYDNVCGSKYYGVHIAFEPVYNMGRLEYGTVRREVIRRNVILNRMWKNGVEDHKNVFFAFVHAAVPPDGLDVSSVVSTHVEQLEQFPQAPLVPVDVDLTGQYTEDPDCSGLAQEAVDVGIRVVKDVMWQRHPWYLTGDAQPTHTLTGLDYMMAYWLGRYHGFIEKDDPVQCLRWH